eukprot:871156-Prymnesium_polylepis.1
MHDFGRAGFWPSRIWAACTCGSSREELDLGHPLVAPRMLCRRGGAAGQAGGDEGGRRTTGSDAPRCVPRLFRVAARRPEGAHADRGDRPAAADGTARDCAGGGGGRARAARQDARLRARQALQQPRGQGRARAAAAAADALRRRVRRPRARVGLLRSGGGAAVALPALRRHPGRLA